MTGQWFSSATHVSFTNKTNRYDIAEILLKVAIRHHTPTLNQKGFYNYRSRHDNHLS